MVPPPPFPPPHMSRWRTRCTPSVGVKRARATSAVLRKRAPPRPPGARGPPGPGSRREMSAATLAAKMAGCALHVRVGVPGPCSEARQIDTGGFARGIYPLADGGEASEVTAHPDALDALAREKESGFAHSGRGTPVQVHISSRNPVARGGGYAGFACCRIAGVSAHRSEQAAHVRPAPKPTNTRRAPSFRRPSRRARSRARGTDAAEVFPHRSTSDTTRSHGISSRRAAASMMRMFA